MPCGVEHDSHWGPVVCEIDKDHIWEHEATDEFGNLITWDYAEMYLV